MKTRKELKYNDIIHEVNSSLNMFQPNIKVSIHNKVTKKKIE